MARDYDYELFKPRNEVNVESDEFYVEFDKDTVKFGRYVEFQNDSVFSDYVDESYNLIIATANEIEGHVEEYLGDTLDDVEDGTYTISGWIAVPYDIYYPVHQKPSEDNVEIDVLWSDMYSSGFELI